jgi:hypothetical protein
VPGTSLKPLLGRTRPAASATNGARGDGDA